MSDSYVVVAVAGKPTKATILKDPNATLDYTLNWTDWMAEDPEDTITAVEIIFEEITDDAAPLVLEAQGFTSEVEIPAVEDPPTAAVPALHTTTAFVSGGTTGNKYDVTFRITTASTPPRIEDRTIVLDVKER